MKTIKLIPIAMILSLALFSACSEDESKEDPTIDPTIKLKSSEYQIVPFKDIKVSIDVDLDVLYEAYDSITWKANGVAYSYFIWFGSPWADIDDERDVRITDYKLGKHKVYALGHKNGTIISKDSIEYEVVRPNGDFISLKWNQDTQNQYLRYTTGLTPNHYLPTNAGWTKIGGVGLEFNHIVDKKDMEYATLNLIPWTAETNFRRSTRSIPDINDFDWHQDRDSEDTSRFDLEYTFLHNYMIQFYGNPILTYDGDDVTKTTLQEEYAKRFKYTTEYYPVEIWETPASVICLARANNKSGGVNQKGVSSIIAEPRK